MSYVSYTCSRFHKWFQEMGYPRLDIIEYADGEKSIIEYDTVPVIPSLTTWRHVLTRLRNIDITKSFVEKYVDQINPMKKAFWDREDAISDKLEKQQIEQELFKHELIEEASKAIMGNPDLLDRIARNGIQEMGLMKIARHLTDGELKQFGDSFRNR